MGTNDESKEGRRLQLSRARIFQHRDIRKNGFTNTQGARLARGESSQRTIFSSSTIPTRCETEWGLLDVGKFAGRARPSKEGRSMVGRE